MAAASSSRVINSPFDSGVTIWYLACNQRQCRGSGRRREQMLWTLVVILLVLWVLGLSLKIAGGLIHILLVIALVVFLIQLLSGRRV